MGVLKCACGAFAEGKTFEDADVKIDHGIGLSLKGPCSGHPTRMTWDNYGHYDKVGKLVVEKPKPVASTETIMLVGKSAKKSSSDDDDKKLITSLKQKLSDLDKELKESKSKKDEPKEGSKKSPK